MPAGVEGSEWTLVGGSGQTLRLDGGHASGSGGCNRFAGSYALEQGRLSFEPLASTRMACEPAVLQAESDFFSALERTVHASLANGELVLADTAGTELLRFALTAPAIQPEESSWS
jgi:heat shock protein HslJ